jgi:signal transduction histidine kinase
MAGVQTAARAGVMGGALGQTARFSSLNIRLTVLVSVVLIAGSFAAAAALQMRLDRVHALKQAAYYETQRAKDLAAIADAQLDRYAQLARRFADDEPGSLSNEPGVRNVAILDGPGARVITLRPESFPLLSPTLFAEVTQSRTVVMPGLLAFPYKGKALAVAFDPKTLLPESIFDRAALVADDGTPLAAAHFPAGGTTLFAHAEHWPVGVKTAVDEEGALAAWYGSLPLYAFVILGPALVGAWLATLFVREFERRAKASEAIRQLRTARPMEGRLLVRLAEAERRAVESQRSKAEFIAHMSHELRTPLNAIIGFSEVIEHGFYGTPGHPKYVEYAHDIGQAGRALHAKIGDILEFANVEAGRFPLAQACFDLSALASEVANEHMGRAFSRRIVLEIGILEPVEAVADMSATRRIITNLLANALLYTPEGGTVAVAVREEEGAAVLGIRDSGTGFTKQEAARVGDAFLKFDRSGTTAAGTGMGLAVAMVLARRMGGAIHIGGHHGEGTVAELRLPKP